MTDKASVDYWDRRRGRIFSRKGGWVLGQGVSSHGYSMLDDLVGRAGFFQVLVLNVTGKLPEKQLSDWMESAFICLSWPDARIWCNQIGAFGGDARVVPSAAICAGIMASDSRMYGPGTVLETCHFIAAAARSLQQGHSAAEFIQAHARNKGKTMLPGFVRPIVTGDERVTAMQGVAKNLGFEDGPHLAAAYQVQEYLIENHGESLNLAGYMSAFLLDRGMTPHQGYIIFSLCVNGGIHACYEESCSRPAGSFLPLRCDDINYCGEKERAVPHD